MELAKADPTGEDFAADKFVFGTVTGDQAGDIKRARETCVLKAHGQAPAWNERKALTEASREALRAIDLTFHDLRHEAGSRLLEGGWPLHNVAQMLGHANIAQTSTYLNATRVGLQDAMRRLDAARCKPVAKEEQTDRAPLRNEQPAEFEQPQVH